jgi:hypothetical protein
MNKFFVVFTLFCIITGSVVFSVAYVFSQYHFVDHQRYYQITGKFWEDEHGIKYNGAVNTWTVDSYWYHLKGHKDVEADSSKEWNAMSVGNYILVEWQTFERNVR